MLRWIVGSAFAVCVLSSAQADGTTVVSANLTPPTAVAPCPFAGSWTLNTKLSDDPEATLPAAHTPQVENEQGGEGGGGGGYGGGHGGHGGHGGGVGGGGWGGGGGHGGSGGRSSSGSRGAEPDRAVIEAAMSLMREMPESIVVAQHESMFQIVETGGRMTNWQADGKPHLDDRFGTTAQSQIQWDGEKLHEATTLGSGETFEETYTLVPLDDGKPLLQVTRTLKIPKGSRTVSVRRVYEPGS
ncbi:MAG TPA: hypothetical protein VFV19_08065 [Candidatus Polarisedimenticolaceae bacterium]|nr:hypothetical protein [Candidatus Polarisedimenticolaceae bacterium]